MSVSLAQKLSLIALPVGAVLIIAFFNQVTINEMQNRIDLIPTVLLFVGWGSAILSLAILAARLGHHPPT